MSSYLDLKGTSESGFNIGLGSGAVSLQNSSSELHVKNKALSAFLNIKISELLSVSNQLTLNEDATLSGASWKMIIARPVSGMTSSVTYTLPAAPVDGYFLSTDSSGNMNWTPISSPSTADKVATSSTSFSFSDFGSALSLFTLPANALVSEIQVIVDSAFNAGDVEIGLLGNLSKYMPTSASDLTDASQYSSTPTQIPVGTTEALIATFSGSPASGTGRIVVFYSIPS